jgi:hypothetical protein
MEFASVFGSPAYRRPLLAALERLGVDRILVTFYAGSDHECIDPPRAFDRSGTEIDLTQDRILWPESSSALGQDGTWHETRTETEQTILSVVRDIVRTIIDRTGGLGYFDAEVLSGEMILDPTTDPPRIDIDRECNIDTRVDLVYEVTAIEMAPVSITPMRRPRDDHFTILADGGFEQRPRPRMRRRRPAKAKIRPDVQQTGMVEARSSVTEPTNDVPSAT